MFQEYLIVKDLIDKEICEKLSLRIIEKEKSGNYHYDDQCLISPAFDGLLDDLAEHLKNKISNLINQPLWTTYNYCRIYKPGEFLEPHKDKNQCEIAVSLTLHCDDHPWPIFLYSNEKKDIVECKLDVGDALIYKGFDLLHWRNKFVGTQDQIQAFLFYATDDRFLDPFFPGIENLIKREYEWLL